MTFLRQVESYVYVLGSCRTAISENSSQVCHAERAHRSPKFDTEIAQAPGESFFLACSQLAKILLMTPVENGTDLESDKRGALELFDELWFNQTAKRWRPPQS